jgi:hypothetical protein
MITIISSMNVNPRAATPRLAAHAGARVGSRRFGRPPSGADRGLVIMGTHYSGIGPGRRVRVAPREPPALKTVGFHDGGPL